MNRPTNEIVPRIQLLATGGTIASRFVEATQDVRVDSSGSELAAGVATRLAGVEVVIEDALNIASFEMDLEMAFVADLLLDSDKPVVFTGAQRAADDPESDGPRNLVDAVGVAASEPARGCGTLVVFDNEVHFARDVVKTHTSRLAAFESPDAGKAGEIDGDRVLFYRRPATRRVFTHWQIDPRVDLIKLAIGADSRFVDCAVATGARGIVLEAFGRGNVTPKILDAVRRAVASHVSVVVTSRCGRGRVAPVYGGSGGASLARAGALFAGRLTGVKARILLAVLLGRDTMNDVEQGLRWLAV